MITIEKILKQSEKRLSSSTSSRIDVEILLAELLKTNRTYLYTHSERTLNDNEQRNFENLLARRLQGEPVAYIVGHKSFWSFDLIVTKDTLIPRPETELLVELTLELLPKNSALKIADLGTGTGAIALALACERPQWKISATDQSVAALKIAQKNAKNILPANIIMRFYQGIWCAALPHKDYDAIVSNPPYLANDDPHLQQGDIQFEPKYALQSGTDGLSDIRKIIHQARDYLKPGGWLIVEHGYDQGDDVTQLLLAAGYIAVNDHRDLGGHYRVAVGQLPTV